MLRWLKTVVVSDEEKAPVCYGFRRITAGIYLPEADQILAVARRLQAELIPR
jgi:hypothetical protein